MLFRLQYLLSDTPTVNCQVYCSYLSFQIYTYIYMKKKKNTLLQQLSVVGVSTKKKTHNTYLNIYREW
jgi:hypothetical protein